MNINYMNLQRLKNLTLQASSTLKTMNANKCVSLEQCMYPTVQFRYDTNHGNYISLMTVS